jgi:hypothetical protein
VWVVSRRWEGLGSWRVAGGRGKITEVRKEREDGIRGDNEHDNDNDNEMGVIEQRIVIGETEKDGEPNVLLLTTETGNRRLPLTIN